MRIRIGIYLSVLTCLLFTACDSRKKADEQRYTWSSDAPLTIPYRTRIQRFERNNLLRNPSFETGRTFTLNQATTSFVIDGWQQTGLHLEWVDIRVDSLYHDDEAYSGNRAVKVTRQNAYETDEQGEGILSDFIKVIPGNYSLSLYARLQNVFPARSRLGMKMVDGVDIRLLFFDRNKIPLNADLRYPNRNQVIDASFKALSFAHYNSVPSFGWGRIIGKSNHFPFPEGDIPSDAHYVKIYVGLKGTGTLWIDSIDFHYTDRNFSVAESMQSFTDTAFGLTEAIIPMPKHYDRMGSLQFYKPSMKPEQLPVIVIPADLDAAGMNAARNLRDAIEESIRKVTGPGKEDVKVPMVKTCSKKQLAESKLVFSIGKTDVFINFSNLLPNTAIEKLVQGYYLYTPNDFPNLVLLGANNSTGLQYAVLTALQMFDGRAPVFHNARIIDFPDFAIRYYAIEQQNPDRIDMQSTFARDLMQYKLNGAFITESEAGDDHIAKEMMLALDIPDGSNLFHVVPLDGYHGPDDSTLVYNYPLEFEIQKCQQTGILNRPVSISLPGFGKSYQFRIPPAFHNEMLDNSNLSCFSFQPEPEIKNFYSGSSFFSLLTDDADIDRFISALGPNPVFMDNSMRIFTSWGHFGGNPDYPGKIRLFNIFEPFQHTDIRMLFPKLDSDIFFINQPVNSEIDVIRMATASDFLWNAHAYEPRYSLWRVLVSRYGIENARHLILFAEKYSIMLELIMRLEMKSQVARNYKTGQQAMADLTSLVAKLNENLGSSNNLVKELLNLNADLRNRLNLHAPPVAVKK